MLVLTGVVALPLATAMPVAADSPTLMGGPVTGPAETTVSYTYDWDQSDSTAVHRGRWHQWIGRRVPRGRRCLLRRHRKQSNLG